VPWSFLRSALFSRQLAGQRAERDAGIGERGHLDLLARPGQRLDVLVSP
jgi:hypothetical protein